MSRRSRSSAGGTSSMRSASGRPFPPGKREDPRLESLADAGSFGDMDENDPASVARFMKKMGKEFGDDLGDDFESAVDEAMAEGTSGQEGEAGGGGTESV